jgi:hypothetical protein
LGVGWAGWADAVEVPTLKGSKPVMSGEENWKQTLHNSQLLSFAERRTK